MKDIGVYIIFNHLTESLYIGSATVSFENRYKVHLSTLTRRKHRNIHLQRAFDKYGHQWFSFSIILRAENTEEALKFEQKCLDEMKPDYNICKFVEGHRRGLTNSEETRRKLSLALMGRPAWNKGVPFSEMTRAKMSAAKKGTVSPRKGKRVYTNNPIERSDGVVFDNPSAAADALGVKPNTVIKAATDKSIGPDGTRIHVQIR